MSRQVLTYPDIPPVLTQAAADTRYSLVAHNHDAAYATVAHLHTGVYLPVAHEPGVDPHAQYYNQTRGDARYLQTATAATTYLPLAGGNLTGPLTFGGDITLQRTAARNLRLDTHLGIGVNPEVTPDPFRVIRLAKSASIWGTTNADSVQLGANAWCAGASNKPITPNVSGTMLALGAGTSPQQMILTVWDAPPVAAGVDQVYTPKLVMDRAGSMGMSVTPAAWNTANRIALQIGQAASVQAGTATAEAIVGANNGPGNTAIVGGLSSLLSLSGGQATFFTAPNANAGAAQTFKSRLNISPAGTVSLTPDSGQASLIASMGGTGSFYLTEGTIAPANTRLYAGQWMELDSGANIVSPARASIMAFGQPGARWAYLYTDAVTSGPGNLYMRSTGGGLICSMTSPYFSPEADASQNLGYPSTGRWANLWIYYAPTVGSHASMKEDFAPLDPSSCAQAVLETDWISYSYKVPPPPPVTKAALEADERELDEDGRAAKTEYLKYLQVSDYTRHQKGYALGHETLKVSDLFGLSNREERSDGADLAVVACALQHCLLEIAELKARLA